MFPVRRTLSAALLLGLSLPSLLFAQAAPVSVPTATDGTQTCGPAVLSSTRYLTDPRLATAIGCNTEANSGGVAVGRNTYAGIDSTAMGVYASASDNAIAIGSHASANDGAIAIGGSAVADSLAIGGNTASSNSVAIWGAVDTSYGASTNALTLGGTAGGKNTTVLGIDAVAINGGTAVGSTANAKANGVAVGSATTSTNAGVVIGTSLKANTGVTIGSTITQTGGGITGVLIGNTVTGGTQSVSIGNGSSAVDGSVAVGQGSKADTAAQVSFGTTAATRLVSHITAGKAVDDAVNVAQLNQMSGFLTGGTYTGTGALSIPTLTIYNTSTHTSASQTTVTGAVTNLSGSVNNLDTRLQTVESSLNTPTVLPYLATSPSASTPNDHAVVSATGPVGSVAIGANAVATEDGTVSVGSSTVRRRLVNVANGTSPTDAANLGQVTQMGALIGAGVTFTNGQLSPATFSAYNVPLHVTVQEATIQDAFDTTASSLLSADFYINQTHAAQQQDASDIAGLKTRTGLFASTPGAPASVTSTGLLGSVAMGPGSVATEDGTVSVGSSAGSLTRRLVNVGAGLNGSDATTLDQLSSVAAVFGPSTFSGGVYVGPSFSVFDTATHTGSTSTTVTGAFSALSSSIANLDSRVTTLETAPQVPGPPGPQGVAGIAGQNGTNGASAYDIAVQNGYTGTEVQWAASLKGDTGQTGLAGQAGTSGASAYDIAVQNGYTGTEAQWTASLKGAVGQTGQSGSNGSSAYQLAVQNGFSGTEADWLNSLKGKDGASVGATDTSAMVRYDAANHASVTLGSTADDTGVALHNVANGTVAAGSTDAVNGGQLYASEQNTQSQVNQAIETAKSYTNTQVQAVADWSRAYTDSRFHDLDRRINAQGAISAASTQAAAALGGIDTRYRNRWATGVGSNGGTAANAIMFQHVSENGQTSWNAGAAVSQGGQTQVGVGYAVGF
jgi:hypothetical protein